MSADDGDMDDNPLLTRPAPGAWSPFVGVERRLRGALAVATADPSAWQPAVLTRLLRTITAMLLEHHATIEPPAFATVWHRHAHPDALVEVLGVAYTEAAALSAQAALRPAPVLDPLADPEFRRRYYQLLSSVAYASAIVRCLPMSAER